ncbi:hypothetical protein [Sphingobium lactosutens]|uniref:hypothetical protein n=1 Tax=Sphingobium lactosutens TaxID=522773 RepID=UPI0015BB961B|nr:hypothetical protein [Sphingobium lactosutens]
MRCAGFWTPAIVDRYFTLLRNRVGSEHARGQPIRAHIAKRGAPVHSQETMRRVQELFNKFCFSGDKVAAIVDTSLTKMQFIRTYSEEICRPFLSETAALAWLSV